MLVMASGNGSNFQAVADAVASERLPIEIVALLSNNLHAFALTRARNAGIPSHVVVWNRRDESREAYDRRLLDAVAAERPDLVLMLGWMHLLSNSFVDAFQQIVNLHPAFLPLDSACDEVTMPDGTQIPAFRGPRAVTDALAASSPWVGATLHRVTRDTDRGPVLTRKPLRVRPGEEEAPLMARVHELERGVVRSGLMRWLYER
ncbi:MAG: phosphoribosylglycinamide formyltransferase [Candidatus Eremiobacteraeota bacterium]|nr:phosphoribosylglycinamide formyltransferase [Candidatus Eremiobacteraeota bacterium]